MIAEVARRTPLADNNAVVDAYLGSHHDQALEFDDEGNPVGATAVLAEALEKAEARDPRDRRRPLRPRADSTELRGVEHTQLTET